MLWLFFWCTIKLYFNDRYISFASSKGDIEYGLDMVCRFIFIGHIGLECAKKWSSPFSGNSYNIFRFRLFVLEPWFDNTIVVFSRIFSRCKNRCKIEFGVVFFFCVAVDFRINGNRWYQVSSSNRFDFVSFCTGMPDLNNLSIGFLCQTPGENHCTSDSASNCHLTQPDGLALEVVIIDVFNDRKSIRWVGVAKLITPHLCKRNNQYSQRENRR